MSKRVRVSCDQCQMTTERVCDIVDRGLAGEPEDERDRR